MIGEIEDALMEASFFLPTYDWMAATSLGDCTHIRRWVRSIMVTGNPQC